MENKLGLYVSNLMATIVDKEETVFVRKLAFNELENISKDISSFLTSYISEIKPDPFQEEQNKAFKLFSTASHKYKKTQRNKSLRNTSLNAFIVSLVQIFLNSFHVHKVVPEVIDLFFRWQAISDPYFSIWSSRGRGEF